MWNTKGKRYLAKTYKQHIKGVKLGHTHKKPKKHRRRRKRTRRVRRGGYKEYIPDTFALNKYDNFEYPQPSNKKMRGGFLKMPSLHKIGLSDLEQLGYKAMDSVTNVGRQFIGKGKLPNVSPTVPSDRMKHEKSYEIPDLASAYNTGVEKALQFSAPADTTTTTT